MTCRESGCQRSPQSEFVYCPDHLRALLARAYGRAVRETEHGARTLPPARPMLRLFDRPNIPVLGRSATE